MTRGIKPQFDREAECKTLEELEKLNREFGRKTTADYMPTPAQIQSEKEQIKEENMIEKAKEIGYSLGTNYLDKPVHHRPKGF